MKSPGREFQELQSVCCRFGALSMDKGNQGSGMCFTWLGEFQNPLGKWLGPVQVPVCASVRKGQEGSKGNPWDQGWICWQRKEGEHKVCIHTEVAAQVNTFFPLFMTRCRKIGVEGDVGDEGCVMSQLRTSSFISSYFCF